MSYMWDRPEVNVMSGNRSEVIGTSGNRSEVIITYEGQIRGHCHI